MGTYGGQSPKGGSEATDRSAPLERRSGAATVAVLRHGPPTRGPVGPKEDDRSSIESRPCLPTRDYLPK